MDKNQTSVGTTPTFLTEEYAVKQRKQKKNSKRIIIITIVVAFVAAIAITVYFLCIKPGHEKATESYLLTYLEYKVTLSEFEALSEQVQRENDKLLAEITDLQDTITYGGKPYDANTIVLANDAINKGKIAKKDVPELDFATDVKDVEEFFFLRVNGILKYEATVQEKIEKLETIIGETEVPDYTKEAQAINNAQKNLEDSIRQLEQVTAPSEAFVLERVMEIKDAAGMIDIIALTEDTDTNNLIGKNGWYTSKIIFRHKDVRHYGLDNGLLTLSEVGNPAGGCIETYRTVEDAERRDAELTDMEGTASSPGAHFVCGTMVIRVTENLKTSTQTQLMEMLIEALLRLED